MNRTVNHLNKIYKSALAVSRRNDCIIPIPKTSLTTNNDVNRYITHLHNFIRNPELYYLIDCNNTTKYMKFNVKRDYPPNIKDMVKLYSEKD